MAPVEELTAAYFEARRDATFVARYRELLATFVGRPTPLYEARRLGGGRDVRIFLKREDLAHTGAHKINNALGQALLAERMGKRRIVAETGAGQHGVATATACALLGLECVVYMGAEDMARQALNVFRMRVLGAEVERVDAGSRTLKDAINEAMRDWVTNVENTYYLLGSVLGPHPYPLMVREFQSVIGQEARAQILDGDRTGCRTSSWRVSAAAATPWACSTRSSTDARVRLVGVEAGGRGITPGDHAARFAGGAAGRAARHAQPGAAGRRRQHPADAFGVGGSRLPVDRPGARVARVAAAAPSTRGSTIATRSTASSGWRGTKASCRRSSRRTPWPG